ncbi:hypothetical protein CGC58_10480 [Capnocytophaga stomatis]|uniref:CpXC domain-containing protein n=1 Tax=Capnocytophaga stomatis TaxID=1848904 RepID=A0A250FY67_9FLAO|nr:hypothetical protein [Capnocytophaga stomatis]ATA90109.1 hypothetical protein CGC58_10480 [Capnocytophaga stomatis]
MEETKGENTYTVTKTCQCGNKDSFPLTKIEAAFELFDDKRLWKETPCSKCGSTKTVSVSHSFPKIDQELFTIWSENPDYYFIEQDEDLMLAEMDNLDLLLDAFDNPSFPTEKKYVVVSALCVLLYDNRKLPDGKYSKEEKQEILENQSRILFELQKRKDEVMKYKDVISDYIWAKIKNIISK